MPRPRRALAGLTATLAVAPAVARAEYPVDDAYLTPGLLLSVPLFGRAERAAAGLEVGYMHYEDGVNDGVVGLGAFAQVQLDLALRPSFGAGAQGVDALVGGEVGARVRLGDDTSDALIGAHLGPFLTMGFVGTGFRMTFGTDITGELTLFLKVPVLVEGDGYQMISGRPVRAEGRVLLPSAYGLHRPLPPLARVWLEDARTEAASVLAFRRLASDLRRLGAPPSLVRRALAAARDEAAHARLTLGLASRFAGQRLRLAPTPAPRPDLDAAATLDRVAHEAWLDGVVGEGAAAEVALAESATVRDAESAAVLRRIAAEERRHAALSADVLAFALESGGRRARRAVEAARATGPGPSPVDEAQARARVEAGRASGAQQRAAIGRRAAASGAAASV